jgi:hypothetical protein
MYNYFSFGTCVLLFAICAVIYKLVDFSFFLYTDRKMKAQNAKTKAEMKAMLDMAIKASEKGKADPTKN